MYPSNNLAHFKFLPPPSVRFFKILLWLYVPDLTIGSMLLTSREAYLRQSKSEKMNGNSEMGSLGFLQLLCS